ncbi:MAG TPA: TonB-dependent receptor, partial [bacterium]
MALRYTVKRIVILMLIQSALGFAQVGPPAGSVQGRMTDADTRTPLAGGQVMLTNTAMGAVTDLTGRFEIGNVPVGNYSLRMSYVGYAPSTVADVIVKPKRIAFVDAALKPSAIQGQTVHVTAGYFNPEEERTASMTRFSYEEIRRAPGSGGDVSRILTMLPSVAKVNDQSNSLIVRGGHPAENAFRVDGIEVPNINHFPDEASTGGPIGMLNVDLVRNVTFHAGGFSAVTGDRLSSVMEIGLREGNRKEYDVQLDLNFAGFGGVAEGPLAEGRGSWLFSIRRSYLDLVVKMFPIGTTVVPWYGDAQAKAVMDLGKKHALSFIGIFGDDHNAPDRETGEKNLMLYYGNQDDGSNTVGLSWRAVWNRDATSLTSLWYTSTMFKEDWYETNTGRAMVRNWSRERMAAFRSLVFVRFSHAFHAEFGLDMKSLWSDYDNRYAGTTNALGDTVPPVVFDTRIAGSKLGAFVSVVAKPFTRLTVEAGVREDWFSSTESRSFSPRFCITWALDGRTSLKTAGGVFYQTLPTLILAQTEGGPSLKDMRAVHAVFGVDRLLTENTRFTLEAYRKTYDRLPVDLAQPGLSVFDGRADAMTGPLASDGRAVSYGVELLIQKKLADKV